MLPLLNFCSNSFFRSRDIFQVDITSFELTAFLQRSHCCCTTAEKWVDHKVAFVAVYLDKLTEQVKWFLSGMYPMAIMARDRALIIQVGFIIDT